LPSKSPDKGYDNNVQTSGIKKSDRVNETNKKEMARMKISYSHNG
jgi:hypothetical protein